jgi:hypothetical protein
VTEEEEAATGASGLTSLEDLIAIGTWVEGPLDLLKVDIVHAAHSLEDTRREGRDLGAWKNNSFPLYFFRARRSPTSEAT